jgi:type I restriction enzyme, S subunit
MSGTCRLGDFTLALRGRVAANTEPNADGPRFFGIAEISAHGTGSPRYVTADTDLEKSVVLAEGDVVVALLGKIGESAVICASAADSVLGRECVALRVTTPGAVRPAWLCEWMNSEECRFQVSQHTTGTTMERLPVRALENFTITIPPLDDQIIVEELAHRFDQTIAATAASLQELKALRVAEMQLAFSNLRPKP